MLLLTLNPKKLHVAVNAKGVNMSVKLTLTLAA